MKFKNVPEQPNTQFFYVNLFIITVQTTIVDKIYWHNYEKRCCSCSHKQCKTLLREYMLHDIYKHLRLKILGLMSHLDQYHVDGYLVPNPRCGFGFEAAFQL